MKQRQRKKAHIQRLESEVTILKWKDLNGDRAMRRVAELEHEAQTAQRQHNEIVSMWQEKVSAFERQLAKYSSPLIPCEPMELTDEDRDRLKKALYESGNGWRMPIQIVREGMTIHNMTQLVCGQMPEGWDMIIQLQNGYGGAVLNDPEGGLVESEVDAAEAGLEGQILDLLKIAKDKDAQERKS